MTKSPYREHAVEYLMAGWQPIPVPYGCKSPVPEGFTGNEAMEITEDIVLGEWFDGGDQNIALKLPAGIIGIDIDSCKETGARIGWKNLKKLEAELGELPFEFYLSNHEDPSYGFTAFFVVPTEVEKWNAAAAEKIDIIQETHRYQMAWPSLHPSGREYQWRSSTGFPIEFVPEVDSLHVLPQAWVNYLSKPIYEEKDVTEVGDLNPLDSKACKMMNSVLYRRIKDAKLRKGSRHDLMVEATWAIVAEGNKGHSGVAQGLAKYFAVFKASFTDAELAHRDVEKEFNKSVEGAKKKMPPRSFECLCTGTQRAKKTPAAAVDKLRRWRK